MKARADLPEGINILSCLCLLSCIAWVDVCYCCSFKESNRQQRITMFWLHETDIVAKREDGKSHAIGYRLIWTKTDWLTRTDWITSAICAHEDVLAVLQEIRGYTCAEEFERKLFLLWRLSFILYHIKHIKHLGFQNLCVSKMFWIEK